MIIKEVVHSLSHVWLFETPWTAAYWAPLSSIISRVCLNSCPLRKWHCLIISSSAIPFSFCLQSFPFSSIAQSCPTHCNSMDCRPGFPIHHQLLELTQTHVHRVSDAIQPPHPVVLVSSCLQSFPASWSFPVSQFFTSGGQRIGVSASASILPMNIQTDSL